MAEKVLRVRIHVYRDGDGSWCARGVSEDILTHAASFGGLLRNIREAVDVHFDTCGRRIVIEVLPQ
jgi:hypothetical protein